MFKSSTPSVIRLKGVRQNNLKNIDLDLPLNQLIVITGLSGSGKSSLAFDTLFAEGQRRYIETFSPYARQFFDRMDKPKADHIEGIPPAIAIEQRNTVRTTRSTVGTMTEICDHLKILWPHIAQLHCRQCGRPVTKDSAQRVWESIDRRKQGNAKVEVLIAFDLPLSEKLSLEDSLGFISKQGYQRLLLENRIVRLDELLARPARFPARTRFLTVIQDRVKLAAGERSRFVEACEQAYHFGKGRLAVHELSEATDAKLDPRDAQRFSNRLHCAECDLEYREPSPALFSFNHPLGACPTCKGFGRVISIDYDLAVPDWSKSLAEGVVKPWQSGQGAECQQDLMRACRHFEIPTDVPFVRLPKKWRAFVIEGESDYGKDEEHEWPRAWYGVKGYFRWLESKAYKMHVRVLLSRYRSYTRCPDCRGARLQPEALLYQLRLENGSSAINGFAAHRSASSGEDQPPTLSLADFYSLPVRDVLAVVESLTESRNAKSRRNRNDPITLALSEVRSRLAYLNDVGLGYLTLDRPTRSLSGGETERVNLTTCLGTRLVNTLFVLDEPSVGLHPRDTERLVRILQQLRDAGNTVVVVEHEAAIMRAADRIVDLGPGHGATGGEVVFEGGYSKILESETSLTGQYLSGRKQVEIPRRRHTPNGSRRSRSNARGGSASLVLNDAPSAIKTNGEARPTLRITHANCHNLRDLTVEIPLERFVCVTGVSGSGKSTLVREVLLPLLEAQLKTKALHRSRASIKASDRIEEENREADEEKAEARTATPGASLSGGEPLDRVILVDQSILGKTPRSNPAVYIGAFADIREFFAQSPEAKRRGLAPSAFSFNSSQGQCERCRGAGFEKIEMQFLSDVFVRCPDCNGRRYRAHILDVKCEVRRSKGEREPDGSPFALLTSHFAWSIADLLDASVDEACEFLSRFAESRPARRALESLQLLREVGLGYLCVGQPINTLSGGESQRLKLVRHLAEAAITNPKSEIRNPKEIRRPKFEKAGRPSTIRASDFGPLWDFGLRSSDFIPTLFLFDEPTTGLHFDDIRVLLKVFQRLVDAGHSVLVIEHNLDVIKCADWVIDLGPEAGDKGGRIVAQGTPEQIAGCAQSHTGRALRPVLPGERRSA